jgi:Skp family chaperone for outer membrane proteins
MTIKQLAADIRKNVSIFGIFNQSWKHKEMLIKIEGVKKKLQTELDKSHEVIVRIKDKLKTQNKELLGEKLKGRVYDERI